MRDTTTQGPFETAFFEHPADEARSKRVTATHPVENLYVALCYFEEFSLTISNGAPAIDSRAFGRPQRSGYRLDIGKCLDYIRDHAPKTAGIELGIV